MAMCCLLHDVGFTLDPVCGYSGVSFANPCLANCAGHEGTGGGFAKGGGCNPATHPFLNEGSGVQE
jgi:hypothetical protein